MRRPEQNPYSWWSNCVASAVQAFATFLLLKAMAHRNDKLIPIAFVLLGATAFDCAILAWRATDRGYRWAWGLFGIIGFVGVAVVYCLPDRTACPPRGFPIGPKQP